MNLVGEETTTQKMSLDKFITIVSNSLRFHRRIQEPVKYLSPEHFFPKKASL